MRKLYTAVLLLFVPLVVVCYCCSFWMFYFAFLGESANGWTTVKGKENDKEKINWPLTMSLLIDSLVAYRIPCTTGHVVVPNSGEPSMDTCMHSLLMLLSCSRRREERRSSGSVNLSHICSSRVYANEKKKKNTTPHFLLLVCICT